MKGIYRIIFWVGIVASSQVLGQLPPLPTPILEGNIIYVSRKLRMSREEATPPKDFYIDIGEFHGVKYGDVFNVFRTAAVVNGQNGFSSNLLHLFLGELKVILVGEFTSIARLSAVAEPSTLPVLDYPGLMLGDHVVMKTSLPTPAVGP